MIKEITFALEVLTHILSLQNPKHMIVLMDVDQTLITPVSGNAFAILENFKKNYQNHPEFEAILGGWRKARAVQLLDKKWPEVITHLKKLPVSVYGLTKMDIGKIGPVDHMQHWRLKELETFNITFSPAELPALAGQGAFEKGIFFTGKGSKTDVMEAYTPYLPALINSQIVFIDDRQEELEKMEQWCKEQNIPFTGLHFCGTFPESIPHILMLQTHQLIAHQRWLEDSDAAEEVKDNPSACRICQKTFAE